MDNLNNLDIFRSLTFTDQQNKVLKSCMKDSKNIQAFECGGLIFKGSRYYAGIEFARDNPEGGDFYIWLQQKYKIIGQL